MAGVKETLEPTSEPTAGMGDGDDDGTRDVVSGPILLDRWVRVNLKSVPAGQTMNPLQSVAFEDVATTFLADLFQLTVPVVYDLNVEVTGQRCWRPWADELGCGCCNRVLVRMQVQMPPT